MHQSSESYLAFDRFLGELLVSLVGWKSSFRETVPPLKLKKAHLVASHAIRRDMDSINHNKPIGPCALL
jgi:hypothetical protein